MTVQERRCEWQEERWMDRRRKGRHDEGKLCDPLPPLHSCSGHVVVNGAVSGISSQVVLTDKKLDSLLYICLLSDFAE